MKRAVMQSMLYFPSYAACIVLASVLWRQPALLLLGYMVLSGIMMWRWHQRDDLVFYFVSFLMGPLGEACAIYSGAWQYAKPLMLIPVWLPFAWGCAALYIKRTAEAFTREPAHGVKPSSPASASA